ncbi:hypothetical protein [Streptococcus suis]|uniref:hypothetical protein n=1 Tax=Streptococcus suis TaxID=1307 RepID=UPI000CF5106E
MKKILHQLIILMIFVDVCFFILLHTKLNIPLITLSAYFFILIFSQTAVFTFINDKINEKFPDNHK